MNLKLLPYTSKDIFDIGSASAISITTTNRAAKPYPPGNVKVNDTPWPNGAHLGAVDAELTWSHRHRAAQSALSVVHQDAASVAAGPEGSYTVEVLIAGSVVRTQTGITGTSFTYTLSQRTADDADLSKQVQFRITPVNGSLSGTARLTDPFVMQS